MHFFIEKMSAKVSPRGSQEGPKTRPNGVQKESEKTKKKKQEKEGKRGPRGVLDLAPGPAIPPHPPP